MPACGKSVTGVVLAKSLGMNFVDTDLIIQENEGKSLQRIINEEGIEAFKRAEEKTLLSLDLKNTVIATGGSAVYYPSAMEHMGDNGIIVYIEADIEEIKKRLKNIKTRGVAMSKGQSIDELYEIRKPFYEKYADVTVKSDKRSMEVTVEDIIKSLGNKVSCGY
ncbi:MAG TPA: shikimate kinase [Candidatus Copromorpha excrementavium]|uniref:Shikimate kinase n=1 Tax=Candidatus Allocopromorpha excrementavium TaxID=2840741 RepID=A0A9D1HBP1_9FIRM|nr:shikimate kinase [Candidatus Copromorpha excrementavium]